MFVNRFDTGVPPHGAHVLVGESDGEEVGCSVGKDGCWLIFLLCSCGCGALFCAGRPSCLKSFHCFGCEPLRPRLVELCVGFSRPPCTVMGQPETHPDQRGAREGSDSAGRPPSSECGPKRWITIGDLTPGGARHTYRSMSLYRGGSLLIIALQIGLPKWLVTPIHFFGSGRFACLLREATCYGRGVQRSWGPDER